MSIFGKLWSGVHAPNKAAPLDPGPINEDWKVGDLAECIDDDWTDPDTGAPKLEEGFRVGDTFAAARPVVMYGC